MKGDPINLIIGSEGEIISVHPDVLTKSSKFFEAALKKEWTRDSTIKLPDEDFDTVNNYIQWLYSGSVFCTTGDRSRRIEHEYLVKLYVLGEGLLDARFQNRVIDAIVSLYGERVKNEYIVPGAKAIAIIYENTPQTSPARKMMVDIWYNSGTRTWITCVKVTQMLKVPHEFLEDLTVAFFERRQQPSTHRWMPRDDNSSIYYKQDQEETISGGATDRVHSAKGS